MNKEMKKKEPTLNKKDILKEFDRVYKKSQGEQNIVGDQILKDWLSGVIEQTYKEGREDVIKELRSEELLAKAIQETLGLGHHYSTMPVARGIVSALEKKL
jgi:hypothetical protein